LLKSNFEFNIDVHLALICMSCTLLYGESGSGKTEWCKRMYRDYTTVYFDTVTLCELNDTIAKFKSDSIGGKHSLKSLFKSTHTNTKYAIIIDHADYTKTEVHAINTALRNSTIVHFIIVVDNNLLGNVQSIHFTQKINMHLITDYDSTHTKMLCVIRTQYAGVPRSMYSTILRLSDCNWWTFHTLCTTQQYYTNTYDRYIKGNNEMLLLLLNSRPVPYDLYDSMDYIINDRTSPLLFENSLKLLKKYGNSTVYTHITSIDLLCDANIYKTATEINNEVDEEDNEQVDPLYHDLHNWLSVYLPVTIVRNNITKHVERLQNTDFINYNSRYTDKVYNSVDTDRALYKYNGITLSYYECNVEREESDSEDEHSEDEHSEDEHSEDEHSEQNDL
jgi:hypothetical protein